MATFAAGLAAGFTLLTGLAFTAIAFANFDAGLTTLPFAAGFTAVFATGFDGFFAETTARAFAAGLATGFAAGFALAVLLAALFTAPLTTLAAGLDLALTMIQISNAQRANKPGKRGGK
ncbi:MAG: hypothetical protein ABIZ64_18545 [Casimicrobium sp.]